MTHITLLAYENCAMSGVTGVVDAFEIANRWNAFVDKDKNEPLFSWDIVSIDGKPVSNGNKVKITPNGSIKDIKRTDCIFIPGFLPPFDFRNALPDKIVQWIKKWHEKDVLIASTCTGTFFLAETGLLNGKTATTNWYFSRYFNKVYPEVNLKPERMVTEDGGIICSGATSSFFNLCVYLIEKFGSTKLAAYCSKSLLLDPSKQSQSPYMVFDFQKDHLDDTILKAQIIMEENFQTSISVENLASDLGISLRHFIRRFKTATGDSPLHYLQRIRVEAAKKNLETTLEPIEEVTRMVGYEDTNSFRKLFKKHTGLSPKEYRTRFKKTG